MYIVYVEKKKVELEHILFVIITSEIKADISLFRVLAFGQMSLLRVRISRQGRG